MTEEEVFRLKPGDLLRIESSGDSPDYVRRARAIYAVVVEGAGPNVSLVWEQRQSNALPRWIFISAETISSALHRTRLTRIA